MSLYTHTHTPVHSSGSHMFMFWPIPLLMPACNSQTQQSVGFVAVLSYGFIAHVPLIYLHTQQVLVVEFVVVFVSLYNILYQLEVSLVPRLYPNPPFFYFSLGQRESLGMRLS